MDIYWEKQAQERLWHFIKSVKTEVGGFGYARIIGDNEVVVEDVWLAPQWASHSEVDFIDGDGVGYAIDKASADGRLGNDDFVWVSWHSHNTMKAFWSSTDEKCIETYGKAGITRLLSIVGNHAMEYKQRLDFYNIAVPGFTLGQVTFHDLELMDDPADPAFAVYDAWNAEIDEMIKVRPASQKQIMPSSKFSSPGFIDDRKPDVLKDGAAKLDANKATGTRSDKHGQWYWFTGIPHWVHEKWVDAGADDFDRFDSYKDDDLELGASVHAAMMCGEIDDVNRLSNEEHYALMAYLDVISGADIPVDGLLV